MSDDLPPMTDEEALAILERVVVRSKGPDWTDAPVDLEALKLVLAMAREARALRAAARLRV